MKKTLLILLLCALLLPSALAESGDGRLYPAKDDETGLWGYIDASGNWAIAPQYDGAEEFRGDYACAMMLTRDEDDEETAARGIIGRDGNWVVAPKYRIYTGEDGYAWGGLDTGYYDVEGIGETGTGFFDVQSGCFSGLRYSWLVNDRYWPRDRLILVEAEGRLCFADMTTGEIAITLPEEFAGPDYYVGCFQDGYSLFVHEKPDRSGYDAAWLMDAKGEYVDFGGLVFYDDFYGTCAVADGVIAVMDPESGLWGYYDLRAGDFVIAPRFLWADGFSESGCACVETEDGCGIIDREGNLLARGMEGECTILGEYALDYMGETLLNLRGEAVITLDGGYFLTFQDPGMLSDTYQVVSAQGLVAVSNDDGFDGVMDLRGEWVLAPREGQNLYFGRDDFVPEESWRFFSESLQAVERDGMIAFMNADGKFITDFIYDNAGPFLGELARVWRGDMEGYIDRQGNEVYFWQTDADD